jgi:predicted RND superfamily exporter protein
MQNISQRVARLLYECRLLFIFLVIGITAFFAFYALKVEFNFSPDTIFIENDEAYRFYKEIYLPEFAHLGTPCIVTIAAQEGKDLTNAVNKVADTLAHNHHITQIISPYNQPVFTPTAQGITLVSPVDKSGNLTKVAFDYFLENPLYAHSLVSKTTNAMAIVFMLDLRFQDEKQQIEAVQGINANISELKKSYPDLNFYITGLPFIQNEMVSLLKSDQLFFVPILALLLAVLLVVMTKHPLGALFPLLIIFLALVWTVGYLSFVGHEINVVNNAIFILIMVIGIADAVHIYTRFIDESKIARYKNNGIDPNKGHIIVNTINAMLVPCFLTSATTSLGFVASSAAGITIIKQFSIDIAIGVMFCFVATFMIMPALLSLHPIPHGHEVSWLRFWPKKLSIDALLRFSIGKSLRFAKTLSIIAIIVIAISIWLGSNINAHQTWVGELPKDNPVSLALDFIENHFTGVMPFYVVFSGEKEKLQSLACAKAISEIATALRNYSIKPVIRSPFDTQFPPCNKSYAFNPR